MFRQVVVGISEHGRGRDAIALAQKLARDGELTLAYVYVGGSGIDHSVTGPYNAVGRDRGLGLLDCARRDARLDARLHGIGSSSVARGLRELAVRHGADLVVLGSRRRSLLEGVMVGDPTRAALNGAPCAVAIAPAGYANQPHVMRKIGVGYDGSPESEHALELARRIANEHGARLSAFRVVALSRTQSARGRSQLSDSIEALVDKARGQIAALGGVEPHASHGHAAEELAVYSASLDLLVVGSRGYGPIGRLIHGSTSGLLTHTARCPLLVLPRAARVAQTLQLAEDDRSAVTP